MCVCVRVCVCVCVCVPEYIILLPLCKIESRCVAKVTACFFFFNNLATNIKLINLKSLIDFAYYGNIRIPHCMSWQKKMFFRLDSKYKVAIYSSPILLVFCHSQTKHSQNSPVLSATCFATILNCTQIPWSVWNFSSRVDYMRAHFQHKLSN